MNKKKPIKKQRSWLLVLFASILILLGSALVIISVVFLGSLGWWSLLFGLSGIMTAAAGIMSIVKNDPSWILLDLILPV